MSRYPKPLFIICLLVSISYYSASQIVQRNILQPFEAAAAQSLVSRSQWQPFPQTPGAWKAQLPEKVYADLLQRGEVALKKEFQSIPAMTALDFVRNGNRTAYESISFGKRSLLWDLVLAEAVEGKGRFINKIVDGVWSVCEESFWGVSAHLGMQKAGAGLPDVQEPVVDLFAAETAALLAWTDYFTGAALQKESKLIRPRISYEVNRRVLTPMITAKYGYLGNGNPDARLSNWAPWVASNYLAASLLLEENETRRAEAVIRSMKIFDQYMNGLGDDGSTEEGPSYWFAAGACVFDGLNLLHAATGGRINVYDNDFVEKMGAYISKTHIAGDYFINVADANPSLKADGLLLFRFGAATGDDYLKSFGANTYKTSLKDGGAERFFRTRMLYNLTAITDCQSHTGVASELPDVWLPGVQLMASRSLRGLFVASHGGDNGESHNHNDIGDFIVYANGHPVIIDAGRGTYTARTFSKNRYSLWFNNSAYHNLPLINGFQQSEGRKYAASDVEYATKGNISKLALELAKAYPEEAGIISWRRTVEMNRAKGIEVTDKYLMRDPLKSLSQFFMTVCDADIATPGVIRFRLPDSSYVTLSYDAVAWKISKEKIELTTPEDKGMISSWAGKDIYRIMLQSTASNKKGTIRYSIRL